MKKAKYSLPPSIIAGITGLFLLIIGLNLYNHYQKHKEQMVEDASYHLQHIQSYLTMVLQQSEADLIMLANDAVLNRALQDVDAISEDSSLKQQLLNLARSRRHYDQVRLLDLQGRELVRIEFQQGSYDVVPNKQLQSKASRYYVNEILKLSRGSIYISPFDLNMEHGKLEEPYKPMLRFGKPLYSEGNEIKGILVINLQAEVLLNRINELTPNWIGQAMLLNQDGYWILHPEKEREWGFLLSDRSEEKIHRENLPLWQRMQELAEGEYGDLSGIYLFREVNSGMTRFSRELRQWYSMIFIPRTALLHPSITYFIWQFLLLLPLFYLALFGLKRYYALKNELYEGERALRYQEVVASHWVDHKVVTILNRKLVIDLHPGDQAAFNSAIVLGVIDNFVDILRGEGDPEGIKPLNQFYRLLEETIDPYGGIIGRYNNDQFLLLFPHNTSSAVEACKELRRTISAQEQKWSVPLTLSLVIDSGELLAGVMGTEKRFEVNILGEPICRANRISKLSGLLDVRLLMSENGYQTLDQPTEYPVRFVERLEIPSAPHPVSVYELFVSDPAEMVVRKRRNLKRFEDAVSTFHLNMRDKAFQLFQQLHQDLPDDRVVESYLKRCYEGYTQQKGGVSGTVSLQPVEWNNRLLVGHEEIDAQHQELIHRINQLILAIQNGDSEHDINATYAFLNQYVVHG